ncbi:hypothetical protein HYV89_00420 [Candidatus Woesearchaeota archaeon]|nr:hypothetical protein [Candidatus Woesearchaeota archaeon]
MENKVLLRIHEDLEFIKQKVIVMDNELEDISKDLHIVRPEYLKKLEKIQQGKFHSFDSKEKFIEFLDNEI